MKDKRWTIRNHEGQRSVSKISQPTATSILQVTLPPSAISWWTTSSPQEMFCPSVWLTMRGPSRSSVIVFLPAARTGKPLKLEESEAAAKGGGKVQGSQRSSAGQGLRQRPSQMPVFLFKLFAKASVFCAQVVCIQICCCQSKEGCQQTSWKGPLS